MLNIRFIRNLRRENENLKKNKDLMKIRNGIMASRMNNDDIAKKTVYFSRQKTRK